MAVAGKAAMINWCNVAVADRPNFYNWHTHHHMQDRVSIGGFLRCRRFIAERADKHFFIFYEIDDLDVLSGEAYLNRLRKPSEMGRRNHGLMTDGMRVIATVRSSMGSGQGGAILTLRLTTEKRYENGLARHITEAIPRLIEAPGILSAHFLETDFASSAVTRPGVKPRSDLPSLVLIIEAISPEALEFARHTHVPNKALLECGGILSFDQSLFRHEVTVGKHDVLEVE